MATAIQKITSLGVRRNIPFNKLVLSQANVRRVKQGVSIDTLAESIARRGLLQNLNVRPVLDEAGTETGMFKVPAGGRRFRALEQLVRAKRLVKTFPIPCNVRDADSPISEEEDSLSENTDRENLDPIDQYRAFRTLVDERGLGIEEVAAIYAVTPAVVRQRLRLAAVSESLIDLYATEELTLEQLMAFSVSLDHARQEQVWAMVAKSPYREPYQIRRMLTEGAVRASDRRALFVGVAAYEDAGGTVLRDLFQHDDGGWLQDPAVLDRLALDKLQAEAQPVADEGWKWIEVAMIWKTFGAGDRTIHTVQSASLSPSSGVVALDPLSDVLSLLRPRSAVSAGLDAGGEWAIRFPPHEGIKFNAFMRGACWVRVDGETEPRRIEAGDCFLLTRGRPFLFATDLTLPPIDSPAIYDQAVDGIATCNGGGDFFLIGGRFAFEGDYAGLLFDALPAIVHLRDASNQAAVLRWALDQLSVEISGRCARSGADGRLPRPDHAVAGAAPVAGERVGQVVSRGRSAPCTPSPASAGRSPLWRIMRACRARPSPSASATPSADRRWTI